DECLREPRRLAGWEWKEPAARFARETPMPAKRHIHDVEEIPECHAWGCGLRSLLACRSLKMRMAAKRCKVRCRHCNALFLREGSRMTPVAGHDKISDGLAAAGGEFAFLQLVGQGIGVARIADRDRCHGLPVVRDVEDFAGFVGVEA